MSKSHSPRIFIIAPKQIIVQCAENVRQSDVNFDFTTAFSIFQPINRILTWFGIARADIRTDSISELSRGEKLGCLKLIFAVALFYCIPLIDSNTIVAHYESAWKYYAITFAATLQIGTVINGVTQSVLYTRSHIKLLENFVYIDNNLPLRQKNHMYSVLRKKNILYLFFVTLVIVIILICDILFRRPDLPLYTLSRYIFIYILFVLSTQYLIDISNICLRASFVNDFLEQIMISMNVRDVWSCIQKSYDSSFHLLTLSRNRRITYIMNHNMTIIDIPTFMRIYDKISDEILIANQIYSGQLLFGFIYTFLFLVVTFGYEIRAMVEGNFHSVASMAYNAQYCLVIGHVIAVSSALTREMETTKDILNKILDCRSLDSEQRNAIEDFLRICESGETAIKPYQLFTLNYSMICGFITTIVSYSIIIIQLLHGNKCSWN